MRTELTKLHKQLGTTFVYVTHDQTEAMTMGDRIVVMDKGIVQQVDTPQRIYDAPCNAFVAGFIGSPRMNILDVALNAGSKGYFLEINGDKLYIPVNKASDALKPYIGHLIRLGIRPADILDNPAFIAANAGSVISATVNVRELMGSEVHLYLKYGKSEIIARVATTTTSKVGDEVRVAFDMDKIHLYDIESEIAIF